MRKVPLVPIAALLSITWLGAQSPVYRLQPAATPGAGLDSLVLGERGQPFATLFDLNGNEQRVLGERFWLGFTPALTVVDAGVLSGAGIRAVRIPTPSGAAVVGLRLFGQAVVLGPRSPNGLFRATNGESAILYRARHVLVQAFDDPVGEGMTGDWDKSVRGRLQAAPPVRRTVRTVDPNQGYKFDQPLLNPLNPWGLRMQMVLRPLDLRAVGREELVTAIRWRPFGGKVTQDAFQRIVIDLGHSLVRPDFRVDLVSALPRFPNSGLARAYASNVVPRDPQIRVYDGSYTIRPGDLRKDGYLPYPAPTSFFRYNGIDSLLLDFKVVRSARSTGVNGQQIYLMVASSPRPDARVLTSGKASAPVDPFGASLALQGDNSMYDYQIDLTRVRSDATSRWLDSGRTAPDYHQPFFAASTPSTTSFEISYRGARDARGSVATLWSPKIDHADGYRYLQYRVTLRAHPDGAVSSLDTLVIPID